MKRSLKNFIMILIIIVLSISCYFTINNVKNQSSTKEMQMLDEKQGTPPEKPSENLNGENTTEVQQSNMGSNSQPPEKPSGDLNGGNMTGEQQPNFGGNGQTPPEMPNENTKGEKPEDAPSMSKQLENKSSIQPIYYVLFVVESLAISALVIYLIMSQFNKFTLKETLDGIGKVVIFIILIAIITAILTLVQISIANKIIGTTTQNNFEMAPGENLNSSSTSVTKTGEIEIQGETKSLTDSYSTSESDKSVILVENEGNVTIDGANISKTGGDSSNTENSEFYGVNAGILVTENSTATIRNANISTNAKGSNAVFSTGSNSKIYISDSTINTTGSGSARGLDATYGGYVEADNVSITTKGGSCATLATDRGEGTVIAKNSKLETNGSGSPVIYSTGDIQISNTEGTANGSQMVVIEGKNSATVTKSNLTASGTGNRGEVDQSRNYDLSINVRRCWNRNRYIHSRKF